MPILIYTDCNGQAEEYKFSDEVSLGSDPNSCGIVLPREAHVAPWHAVIIRSALNRAPLLVNLAGQNTWVNNRPVVDIQVLRQRDRIQLGEVYLTMWEIRVTALPEKHRAIGMDCQVCLTSFDAEDEVVECPRCGTVYHRDCWFDIKKCANYICDYSVYANILNAIAPWVTFHGYLDIYSELAEMKEEGNIVKEGKRCLAGEPRDLAPFQIGDQVVYCPTLSCHTPYHLACWLKLEECKVCQYDVGSLINRIFSANAESAPETRDVYE